MYLFSVRSYVTAKIKERKKKKEKMEEKVTMKLGSLIYGENEFKFR